MPVSYDSPDKTSSLSSQHNATLGLAIVVEFGEAIKNPAYRILQTGISGCLDSSAHA